MKRVLFILFALSSLPLAAAAGEPKDQVLAKEALQEIKSKWKAAVDVDGNDPDFPVIKLSFSNCHADDVTDAVLARLKVFPRLRELTINSEAVSDDGLKQLLELPELRKLILIRVPVTAEGIGTLRALPHLQQLTLRRMAMSRESVKELKEALPRTTVEWIDR
ncbi:MAG TPA: hypothetical protein VKE40_04835 [Gemmataceae bacterium]|nr:hypothetical protein [Gemmataceae bacterium]